MRTTLDLDAAILEAARSYARQTRQSIGKVISNWARQGFSVSDKSEGGSGFPKFNVPKDADPITLEKVRELLDDEGLSS
jgi:hypothetical protein